MYPANSPQAEALVLDLKRGLALKGDIGSKIGELVVVAGCWSGPSAFRISLERSWVKILSVRLSTDGVTERDL